MKIDCLNCGKRIHVDDNHCICKYCGYYNRQAVKSDYSFGGGVNEDMLDDIAEDVAEAKTYRQTTPFSSHDDVAGKHADSLTHVHNEVENHEFVTPESYSGVKPDNTTNAYRAGMHTKSTTTSTNKKNQSSSAKKIAITVVIIYLVINFAIPFLYVLIGLIITGASTISGDGIGGESSIKPLAEYDMGEQVYFYDNEVPTLDGGSFTFHEAYIYDTDYIGIIDGYKVLVVPYTHNEIRSGEYIYYDMYVGFDGYYTSHITDSYLDDFMTEEEMSRLNVNRQDWSNNDCCYIFIIPEEITEAELTVTQKSSKSDYSSDQVDGIYTLAFTWKEAE